MQRVQFFILAAQALLGAGSFGEEPRIIDRQRHAAGQLQADLQIGPKQQGGPDRGFSPSVATALRNDRRLRDVEELRFSRARIAGGAEDILALDPRSRAATVGIDALSNEGAAGVNSFGQPNFRFGFNPVTGLSREHETQAVNPVSLIPNSRFIGRYLQAETSATFTAN